MRYLVTTKEHDPFLTNYFDAKNHFNSDIGMIVYDLLTFEYTVNGTDWIDIEEDHL